MKADQRSSELLPYVGPDSYIIVGLEVPGYLTYSKLRSSRGLLSLRLSEFRLAIVFISSDFLMPRAKLRNQGYLRAPLADGLQVGSLSSN